MFAPHFELLSNVGGFFHAVWGWDRKPFPKAKVSRQWRDRNRYKCLYCGRATVWILWLALGDTVLSDSVGRGDQKKPPPVNAEGAARSVISQV